MTSRPTPQDIIEVGLSGFAGLRGTVLVEQHQRVDHRFAASTLTTNGVADSTTITIVAVEDRPDGSGIATESGTVRTRAELENLVQRACVAAREAPMSAERSDLPGAVVDTDFGSSAPALAPDVLRHVSNGLGMSFGRSARTGIEWFGYAERTVVSTWAGTTSGTRRVHHQHAGRLETTGKADHRRRSAWVGLASRTMADIDVDAVEAELARRLAWSRTHVDIEPGRSTVVLPSGAVIDLVVPVLWAAGSRVAREGSSAFSGADGPRIGDQVGIPGLTLASEPTHAAIGVRPFALATESGPTESVLDNGATLERVAWIDDGRLRHLIGPRAERDQSPAARMAAENVVVEVAGGVGSLDEVVARVENGLLITCLWYIREVDPQSMLCTGLTRDGVYVVRDGVVVGEAGNFRFNESPLQMMERIIDAGQAQVAQPREWADEVDSAFAPPLVVDGFNLSTRSDAR